MAEQFELLLQQLMSPENDVRTPAETAYEAIKAPQKVLLLIQVLLFNDLLYYPKSGACLY